MRERSRPQQNRWWLLISELLREVMYLNRLDRLLFAYDASSSTPHMISSSGATMRSPLS